MPNQDEVEKFKITPEMKGFLKTYKAYDKIGKRLRNKMQIQLDETNQTRQMLAEIEKGMQMLTLNAPERPTFETEGQEQEQPQGQQQEQQQQGQPQQQSFNPMINY